MYQVKGLLHELSYRTLVYLRLESLLRCVFGIFRVLLYLTNVAAESSRGATSTRESYRGVLSVGIDQL